MRNEYADVIREVTKACEEIAANKLAEQTKQHEANHQKELLMTAAIYEREIAKLEREIVKLKEEILLDVDRIIALNI